MTAMRCPRCGQGSVQQYRFNPTDDDVQVCDECEALWLGGAAIGTDGFQDLEDFARRHGGTGAWHELEPVAR